MPRLLNNWNFDDVVNFLKQHFFIEMPGNKTGHRFFQGYVDGKIRLLEVQFHSHKPISTKSLQHDIIPKSGIPENYWKRWADAGNKKQRKKVQYKGATESNEISQ